MTKERPPLVTRLDGFFLGFGRGMAGQIVLLFALLPFLGTGSADFESAMAGILVMTALSCVFGLDTADRAVRHWRSQNPTS